MLVSTRGRYALRVMMELAARGGVEYISLGSIAESQNISVKYLESIIAILVKAGLLDGVRGKGGGYRMNRKPEEYSVGEILRLTEGTLAPVSCLGQTPNKCERAGSCRTLPMWEKLDSLINGYLDNVKISDLLDDGNG